MPFFCSSFNFGPLFSSIFQSLSVFFNLCHFFSVHFLIFVFFVQFFFIFVNYSIFVHFFNISPYFNFYPFFNFWSATFFVNFWINVLKCKKATKTTRSWKMHLIISFFADHSHSSLRRCVHYWTLCFFLSSAKGTWQRIQSKTHGQNWSLPNSGNIHEFLISVKKCQFFLLLLLFSIFRCQISFCTTQPGKWTDFIAK